MLFRKNKIDQGIKDNAAHVSGDFESLDKVQAKLKKGKLTSKIFLQPYHSFVAECKTKQTALLSYFKINSFKLLRLLFFSLIVMCFVYGLSLLLVPFYGAHVGDLFAPVNNFYTAALSNNAIVYSLTPAAIGFIVVLILSAGFVSWYLYREAKTVNKLLIYTNKKTEWVSISIYITTLVAFLLILILVLIPPDLNALKSYQDATNNMAIIAAGKNSSDVAVQAVVMQAIKDLYGIYDLPIPTGTVAEMLTAFFNDYANGLFYHSTVVGNYSVIFNISALAPATLSVAGIVIVTFLSVFAAAIIIFLPLTNIILNIQESSKAENIDLTILTPSTFIMAVYIFFKNINWKINFKRSTNKPKKETFGRYKKQLKETGMTRADESAFTSSQTDNSVSGVISQTDIEAHEPNNAFLNPNGDWMYHDGQGNYFIAKNDVWVKYDINQAVHKITVDKVNELGLSPSKKTAKKGFFNNDKFAKLPKPKKNNSEVALPDDDLDEILKKLDI